MDETLDLLTGGDLYKVLRLVMINSGSAAYVEIPIDQTAALLSKNNKGKTSALNALKLFLLPEVNFKSCESKFGFSSGGTVYTGLDSFNYYFPSPTSFIILEASNVQGDFCIVLHQNPKEELGYSRMAVPEPYEMIRHLFWESGKPDNQGMGRHPIDFSLSSVQKNLQKLKSTALTDHESIKTALYTRVSPTKPETRFCLMPLVQQPKTQMMRSIKALLQLSFDIKGADTKNLPLAIANIIDCDVSTGREPINIDFKKIQADRQRLRQDANHIHSVKGHRDDWSSLVNTYKAYEALERKWKDKYVCIDQSIQSLQKECDPQYLEAQRKYKEINEESKKLKSAQDTKKSSLSSEKGKKHQLEKDYQKLEKSIVLAENVISREKPAVHTDDPQEVAGNLKNIKAELENELLRLKDRNKASERLQELVKNNKSISMKINSLETQLESNDASLLGFLDSKSSTVLNSLNPNLRRIKAQPMEREIQAINEFTALFSLSETSLSFREIEIENTQIQEFREDSLREDLEKELKTIKDTYQSNEKEISELTTFLKAEAPLTASIIENKKNEINEVENEIKALYGYSRDKGDLEDKKIELESANVEIAQLEEDISSYFEELATLSGKAETARQLFESLLKNKEEIEAANAQLQRTKLLVSSIPESSMSKNAVSETDILQANELNNALKMLDNTYNQYQEKREASLRHFKTLISANIITFDPDLAHRTDLEAMDFIDAYQKLRSEFDNIETKEKEHLSQIRNHNHETSVEISMLDSMARAISNFEDKINSELNAIKISNLSSVSIKIKTLDGFNTLRRELANHGTTSDQLMKDSFYERLANFCEKYLTEGAGHGKLDLEKIIREVQFIYEINGKQESTSQSNGTNGMVNAVLLAILMRRLVPEDVTFTIPVVFDEIGSLDEDNLPELRRVVEENYFVLLVANPNNNGYIAQHIGKWHDIYLHRLSEGGAVNKCFAIYLAATESLHKKSENDEQQIKVVEA